jgi:hypothetical protein
MENNQTAVEWLVLQVNSDCLTTTFIRKELIDKAIAMEKDQIMRAYEFGEGDVNNYDLNLAEEYYTENYGKSKTKHDRGGVERP